MSTPGTPEDGETVPERTPVRSQRGGRDVRRVDSAPAMGARGDVSDSDDDNVVVVHTGDMGADSDDDTSNNSSSLDQLTEEFYLSAPVWRDGKADKEGYLQKKGRIFWNKRYAMLRNNYLFLYKNKGDAKPQRAIPLEHAAVKPIEMRSSSKQKYAFEVFHGSHFTLLFNAESANDKTEWVDLIQSNKISVIRKKLQDEIQARSDAEQRIAQLMQREKDAKAALSELNKKLTTETQQHAQDMENLKSAHAEDITGMQQEHAGAVQALEKALQQTNDKLSVEQMEHKSTQSRLAKETQTREVISEELSRTRDELSSFKAKLAEKESECANLEAEVGELKETVEERDATIRRMNDEVAASQENAGRRIAEAEEQLEEKLEQEREKHRKILKAHEEETERRIAALRGQYGGIWKQIHRNIQLSREQYTALRDDASRWTQEVFPMTRRAQELIQMIAEDRSEAVRKYKKEFKIRRRIHDELIDLKGAIRVFCRCRPFKESEMQSKFFTASFPDDGELVITDPTTKKETFFEFDEVFKPDSTQEEVYEDVEPVVTSVVDGYNVCIFAYGQTGSGKTYTMEGPPKDRGVNYRALETLFTAFNERSLQFEYDVTVSLLEIYNEQVRDLLCDPKEQRPLDVRQEEGGTHGVPGLTTCAADDINAVYQLLQFASKNRHVGTTNMNEHSSRSHLVLTLEVHGVNKETGNETRGKLHLIDLAGSERVGKTGSSGARLNEAKFINKSLSALGDVISSLTSGSKHVPFRNSKLTFLLQDSLSGTSKVLMFVQISPAGENAQESICSLQFAARARNIELGRAGRNVESGELKKLRRQLIKTQQDAKEKDDALRRAQSDLKQALPDLGGGTDGAGKRLRGMKKSSTLGTAEEFASGKGLRRGASKGLRRGESGSGFGAVEVSADDATAAASKILSKLTRALAQGRKRAGAVRGLAGAVKDLLQCNTVSVHLLSPNGDIACLDGDGGEQSREPLGKSHSFGAQVVKSGETMNNRAACVVCVALVSSSGSTFGAIEAADKKKENAFPPSDAELLEGIAAVAAHVLERLEFQQRCLSLRDTSARTANVLGGALGGDVASQVLTVGASTILSAGDLAFEGAVLAAAAALPSPPTSGLHDAAHALMQAATRCCGRHRGVVVAAGGGAVVRAAFGWPREDSAAATRAARAAVELRAAAAAAGVPVFVALATGRGSARVVGTRDRYAVEVAGGDFALAELLLRAHARRSMAGAVLCNAGARDAVKKSEGAVFRALGSLRLEEAGDAVDIVELLGTSSVPAPPVKLVTAPLFARAVASIASDALEEARETFTSIADKHGDAVAAALAGALAGHAAGEDTALSL